MHEFCNEARVMIPKGEAAKAEMEMCGVYDEWKVEYAKSEQKSTESAPTGATPAKAESSSTQPAPTGATPAKTETTTIATPQPTQQSKITPPEAVNKTQVEQDKTKEALAGGNLLAIAGMEQLISNTQQQLDVLKQMLALNMGKGSDLEAIAEELNKVPKASFSDNSSMFNKLINGYVGA